LSLEITAKKSTLFLRSEALILGVLLDSSLPKIVSAMFILSGVYNENRKSINDL
jgi:hypothetical protein